MEPSNPYKPPEAPVDRHADAPAMQSVRALLRVLAVAQLALIPLSLMVPDTLPPVLRQLRDEHDAAFFNTHALTTMLTLALLVASLLGLWREKRWAAWLYVGANALGYALQALSGARIASDLTSLVDSAADAAIGATLVVLYLGGYFSGARESQA